MEKAFSTLHELRSKHSALWERKFVLTKALGELETLELLDSTKLVNDATASLKSKFPTNFIAPKTPDGMLKK